MRLFSSVGTLLVVILLASSLFASGVALTGIGAQATALGGNFRGIANDWSAMYWNPAGIAQLKGFHVGGSFELMMPGSKYTIARIDTLPFGIFKNGEFESEPQTLPIPAGGFVYGTGKLSFGLSVFAPFGQGAKWDAMQTADYHPDYPEFDFEDDLQVIDIHPTFAYQVNDKLSVGIGVSFMLTDILIRKPLTEPNPIMTNPEYAKYKDGLLKPLGLADSIYNYLLTDTKLEGNGTGWGFNFGLKYNITECLSIGLSGNYYNDVSLDGKASATTYIAQIDSARLAGLRKKLNQYVQGGALTPEQKQKILDAYSGQKQVKYDNVKGDAKLPLPMTLGGGIAYSGIKNLLLSADVSWTQWSSWGIIKIDIEDPNQEDTQLVENWKDGIRFGLGAEYTLLGPLKIRAGYYTEPSAIPDETLTITIPDISRRHSVSVGASYNLGPLSLFTSYEKIFIGDRTVDTWKADESLTGFDNMAGTYKMNVDNFMFGLGYNF